MDLWVRSQNKERLMKINGLEYIECNDKYIINGYGTNECDNYDLGIYATKKRALEILGEIQNILQPKISVKPTIEEDMNSDYIHKHFVNNGKEVNVVELSTYVYEMPEE